MTSTKSDKELIFYAGPYPDWIWEEEESDEYQKEIRQERLAEAITKTLE